MPLTSKAKDVVQQWGPREYWLIVVTSAERPFGFEEPTEAAARKHLATLKRQGFEARLQHVRECVDPGRLGQLASKEVRP